MAGVVVTSIRRQVRRGGLLLLLLLLTPACGRDATGPGDGSFVEQLLPAGDAAAGVATKVQVRFNRDVVLPTGARPLVLLQGEDTVAGTLRLLERRVLDFTPADMLELGADYRVKVQGLTDTRGEALLEFGWGFSTAGRAPPSTMGARMIAAVEALAHDSMRGRRYGSPDEQKAAQYIRGEMRAAGLTALSADNWLQPFVSNGISSQNVYGVLRGRGSLADQWVVIGAHYDHVGENTRGIFNGADDNASGTAGMLELARVLAAHVAEGGFGTQPRRSVLFMAFGAEEAGLLGSYYFCASPLVPLSSVAGMLNLDMIGRLRQNTITAHGLESAPEWSVLVARYRDGITVNPGGLVGTDYRCFLQRGRPALALFTGLHEDYHQPTDDAARINVEGMTAVANLALGLATNLMLRAQPPGTPLN